MKIGEALYGGQGGGGPDGGGDAGGPDKDGVVDADFEEVDGNSKKSA
jgi:molecular chaperone DnaK